MIDTGSTVSTVSNDFYTNHLRHLELHPIRELLEVECADGQQLPYYGYIEANIQSTGIPQSLEQPLNFPLLVVSTSNYNSQVPLLIGTNILQHMLDVVKDKYGDRYLQEAALFTPWYLAFRGMTIRDKELARNNNRLGIVKSAENFCISIPPNSTVSISGYIDKAIPYQSTTAVLQATSRSVIPSDLDIVPSLTDYCYPANHVIRVDIDNITTRTVQVPPKSILCELQPVKLEPEQRAIPCVNLQQAKDVLSLVTIEDEGLTTLEKQQAENLLRKYEDVFSKSDIDIGHTSIVKHRIDLHDDTPFKQRPRRIPPAMFEEVKDHLRKLLEGGIIKKSKSPWSSNVVLCRKKNNELRMCVDYRQLNLRTKKDSYALPRIEEILDALAGNRFFTILDMKSGYHQVELHEKHKERTAFTVGPLGFYEYHRMPFGLVNAPATYQRLMEECFDGLHLDICFIYLDDLIIFSKTYEEHVERLEKIFQRLREVNLKLSPKKCEFFKKKVKYVGNIVSEEGIEPDPDKINKVQNWPKPRNSDEVRQFLGFVGYYRRFIEGFSTIARPLNDLLPNTKKKTRKGVRTLKVDDKWKWGDEQEQSFRKLKEKLTTYPILGFPDYSLPFELHTDASSSSIGAVLYQTQDNFKRVIAYASRSLSKSEKNYPVHKLEFLALKWAACEKFRDYLYGGTFKVYTDNNPLTYVLTSAKLDAASQRWIADLASFNFEILYRPGKLNADADGLSRIPNQEIITSDSIKTICNSIRSNDPYVQCLSISSSAVDNQPDLSDQTEIDVCRHQYNDPVLRFWIPYVRDGYKPEKHHLPYNNVQYHALLHKNFEKLRLRDGVLIRETVVNENKKTQIIIPRSCIPTVLYHLHTDMGHPGREKTISLIRDRFYWYGMTKDIEHFISNCKRCLLRKTPTTERAPLTNIKTSQPLELVCVDYLKLEKSKGGYENVLVITDHFTRYAQAIATRNQTAKTTAEALFNHFIVHYGIPLRLHSDQGANFESKIIQELCHILGINKSRTTPYHPMGNGLTERFNRTLIKMLGTLENSQKQDWKSHISSLVHAYNSMKQETTGQSPFFLMFGREARLPIDLLFRTEEQNQPENLNAYIKSLKSKLEQSYNLAKKSIQISQEKQKKNYDIKARGAVIQPGDKVLVKIVAFDGPHKLSDKWEEDPYIVISQPNKDIPVYIVKKENNFSKSRTLHRNLLLPIGHVDLQEEKPKPAPRKSIKMKRRSQLNASKYEDSDSDTNSEEIMVHEADSIAHSNDDTVALRKENSLANEEDNNNEEDSAEDEGETGTPLLEDDMHDSGASATRTRDTTRATDAAMARATATTDIEEDTQIKEVDTSIDGNDADDDTEDDAEEDDDDNDLDNTNSRENPAYEQQTEPLPRRSQRAKKTTSWITSGDYIVNQQVLTKQPDWKIRADYLQTLVSSDVFHSENSKELIEKTLLQIISGRH